MDKFAIDLNKVLDEFEFDEDQAEGATSAIKDPKPVTADVVPSLPPPPTDQPASSHISTVDIVSSHLHLGTNSQHSGTLTPQIPEYETKYRDNAVDEAISTTEFEALIELENISKAKQIQQLVEPVNEPIIKLVDTVQEPIRECVTEYVSYEPTKVTENEPISEPVHQSVEENNDVLDQPVQNLIHQPIEMNNDVLEQPVQNLLQPVEENNDMLDSRVAHLVNQPREEVVYQPVEQLLHQLIEGNNAMIEVLKSRSQVRKTSTTDADRSTIAVSDTTTSEQTGAPASTGVIGFRECSENDEELLRELSNELLLNQEELKARYEDLPFPADVNKDNTQSYNQPNEPQAITVQKSVEHIVQCPKDELHEHVEREKTLEIVSEITLEEKSEEVEGVNDYITHESPSVKPLDLVEDTGGTLEAELSRNPDVCHEALATEPQGVDRSSISETIAQNIQQDNQVTSLGARPKEPMENVDDDETMSSTSDSSEEEHVTRDLESSNELERSTDSQDSSKIQRPTSLLLPGRINTPGQPNSTDEEVSPAPNTTVVGPPGSTPGVSLPPAVPSPPPPYHEACASTQQESMVGKIAPYWMSDNEASSCMSCQSKFTLLKRRHHCRGCGKVLCGDCCNSRISLKYMDGKKARVCLPCRTQITEDVTVAVSNSPNPNNPMEYCSTIPPLQQAHIQRPPPTVMVPTGVLKREGSIRLGEAKQVMFSDGIRPGGDLTELDGAEPKERKKKLKQPPHTPPPGGSGRLSGHCDADAPCLLPPPTTQDTQLPPILKGRRENGAFEFEEHPDIDKVFERLRSSTEPPVSFTISKNLFVLLKLVNLDCCVHRECWCVTSSGLSSVGQDEVVILIEREPEEKYLPRDIFSHFYTLWKEAAAGNVVSDLGHTLFNGPFLGTRDNGGFLYVRPTFQCLQKLILPQPPFLVAILIHKWETPWAKVLPLRLLLRLGAEFRYYPCPLVSVRGRRPLYAELAHTIMNLLADFRNYSYNLPAVRGMVIHMEERKTWLLIPKNRYTQVSCAVSHSNESVLALGSSLSHQADSHLVCIQEEDNTYHTQAINIQNKPRKVTGACFVVFNGALKASSGLKAKSSIVEDGLMVQITPTTMLKLRESLLSMSDFTIECGPLGGQADESVVLKWVEEDRKFNIGVKSIVDGRSLEGVPSIRVHNGCDYSGAEGLAIRWTEVFLVQVESSNNSDLCDGDEGNASRIAEQVARATCVALTSHLSELKDHHMDRLGVRVQLHPDKVEYEAGSNGEHLSGSCMNSLDSQLVPVVHQSAAHVRGPSPLILELVFHILLM